MICIRNIVSLLARLNFNLFHVYSGCEMDFTHSLMKSSSTITLQLNQEQIISV